MQAAAGRARGANLEQQAVAGLGADCALDAGGVGAQQVVANDLAPGGGASGRRQSDAARAAARSRCRQALAMRAARPAAGAAAVP